MFRVRVWTMSLLTTTALLAGAPTALAQGVGLDAGAKANPNAGKADGGIGADA